MRKSFIITLLLIFCNHMMAASLRADENPAPATSGDVPGEVRTSTMPAPATPGDSMHVTGDRPLVGLVLGGGGAKGAAEVGALKVLEELDIPIDFIAGTSIGSIVGGLYACGYKAEEIEKLFLSQQWLDLFSNRNKSVAANIVDEKDGTLYVLGFPILRTKPKEQPNDNDVETGGLGILSGRQITQLLDSLTKPFDGIENFDKLPIPFRCVAVDMKSQEEIIMNNCELELAMRASMAIPGAFKPVKWKGHSLVDGGMLNNLPVDVVRAMGAEVVIAIDLESAEIEDDSNFSLKEAFGIGGLLDWAVSRPDRKKLKANREDADVYIAPQLADFEVSSFSREYISTMIERGEKATRAKAQEIKDLIKRK